MQKKVFILVLIAFTIFIFYKAYLKEDNKKNTIINNNVTNIEVDNSNKVLDLQAHYNNSDIIGIVSINNSDTFNYPIAKGNDNDYYLSHDYYKNDDSYGVVTMDYRVNEIPSRKIILYGHSSVKRDTYFNELENYYDKSYYEKHKYITLETINNTLKYEIFSVYVETEDFTYMNVNFDTVESWYNHILKLQNKSIYSTDVELKIDDNILIMQTCSNSYEYKDYNKKYLLVIAKRIK